MPAASSEDIIEFIESLTIGQGHGYGERMGLFPWQKKFVRAVNDDDVDTAAISLPRGNGKTTFVAGYECAFVVGPLAQPGSEVIVCAGSLKQAGIAYNQMLRLLKPWTHPGDGKTFDRKGWRLSNSDTIKSCINVEWDIKVQVLATNPETSHGGAPAAIICDEPAKWPLNEADAMKVAMETSQGKIPFSKMIAIGTRPDKVLQDGHWFDGWLLHDDCDLAVCYSASEDEDPLSWATVEKANPSLKYLPDLNKKLIKERNRAERNSEALQSFKALRLNMGVSDTIEAILVGIEDFRACETEWAPAREGPMIWGIDTGQNEAMSAVTAHWPATGWTEPFACFPRIPELLQRGRSDGVSDLYCTMAQRGELFQFGNRAVDYKEMIEYAYNRWGLPDKIVSDRYKQTELIDALTASGIPVTAYEARGQGMKDGAEDVKRFRRCVVEGFVKFHPSLLLRNAIGGAKVTVDGSGNAKIAKYGDGTGRSKTHRDDSAVATVAAVAEGERWRQREEASKTNSKKRHRGAIKRK